MVGYVKVPSIEEKRAVENEEVNVEKMRNKLIKYVNDTKNLYLNYLENYRVCEYMFSGPHNVAFDFVEYLLSLPNDLREYLIHNIIPVGGFCLTNGFFQRFYQETV